MKTSKRAAGLAATTVAAVVLGAASFAWACTSQAYVSGLSPDSGPAGTRVTVTAENFTPGPVTIRWNSSTGRVLAETTGPKFSVTVTIPDVAPDVYTILAVGPEGRAPATFEVTPATATESGGYRSGPSSSDTSQPSGSATEGSTTAPGSGTSPQSGNGTSAQPAPSGAGTASSDSRSSGTGGAAFPARTANAQSGPAVAPAVSSSGARATGSAPARAASTGAAPAASLGEAGAAPADEDTLAVVSPRAGLAETWSGFESRSVDSRGASLSDVPAASHDAAPVAVGAAMLTLGLFAMFAGFGVAEARRRRVVAGASGR